MKFYWADAGADGTDVQAIFAVVCVMILPTLRKAREYSPATPSSPVD